MFTYKHHTITILVSHLRFYSYIDIPIHVKFLLQFQEVLSIHCKTGDLVITLTGKGVSPLVSLSPAIADNGIMDMGSVLAGEYLEKTFKVKLRPKHAWFS